MMEQPEKTTGHTAKQARAATFSVRMVHFSERRMVERGELDGPIMF
jgi:hypothetical protein